MDLTRRAFTGGLATAGAAAFLPNFGRAQSNDAPILTRAIPSTGELAPVLGLGTWITFNVGNDPVLLGECTTVMDEFFKAGGRMIDSSPMYGSSQQTIGYGLQKLGYPCALLSAEKVWTSDGDSGAAQIEQTRQYWGVPQLDLVQVHNLLSWQAHLETLFAMKADGKLRYVGVTTSHGRRHSDLAQIMESRPLDFIQLTYNVADREAEERLLPLARERGIAVIVNRPFRRGSLITRFGDQPLPDWVSETGASSWPQFLLKFVISHPAVTCAIPATSRVDHVRENMAAATGILPDEKLRQRMIDYIRQL